MSSNDERPIVRVLERQRVQLPEHLDTPRVRERFIAAAASAGMPEALEHRRRSLFAKDTVGVLDIGEIALEILPKTLDGASPMEGRAFLIDLLRFVGRNRGPFAAAAASIRDGQAGLVEVLYGWAVRTIGKYVTCIPRRYVPRTETSTAVRGRIDMKCLAFARPGRDFELQIRYAPLSSDNTISRALRWLVGEVASRTRHPDTRRVALTLLGEFREVSNIDPDVSLFDRVILRPLEEHWAPLLAFGRSLARQRSLNPTAAGSQPSVAVLFTLHDLFERALRRVLHDGGAEFGIQPANFPRHLLHSLGGDKLVRLKPDYVLRLTRPEGERLVVADAKWKDIWATLGAPEPGREDAYQLAAYIAAGRANAGLLFAPLIGDSGSNPISITRHVMAGTGATVDIVGVHVPTLITADAPGETLRRNLCRAVADSADNTYACTTAPA